MNDTVDPVEVKTIGFLFFLATRPEIVGTAIAMILQGGFGA